MITPQFVLAGDATFTVSNGRGDHYTYNVHKADPDPRYPGDNYFLSALTGPDNTNDYTYVGKVVMPAKWGADRNIGRFWVSDGVDRWFEPGVRLTAKSKFKEGDPVLKVARWTLRTIWQVAQGRYRLPAGYSIKHIGRCGRCGQPLTTPESLDTGLGPVCAEIVGVEWKERTGQQPNLLQEV